jgi:hypothetical protein
LPKSPARPALPINIGEALAPLAAAAIAATHAGYTTVMTLVAIGCAAAAAGLFVEPAGIRLARSPHPDDTYASTARPRGREAARTDPIESNTHCPPEEHGAQGTRRSVDGALAVAVCVEPLRSPPRRSAFHSGRRVWCADGF